MTKAPPDGYTLLLTLSNHVSIPKLYLKLPYDTERDFLPIAQIGASPMLMYGLFAPGATPVALVTQINRDVVEVLTEAELRERFATAGVAPRTGTPAEFREFVSCEISRWSKLIGDIGLKPG